MDTEKKTILKNFGYGYLAGMMGIIVSHPIDTLKTQFQLTHKLVFKNLYRGVFPPLVGVGLEKAVVFGVFESTKKYTGSDVVSGALSGLSASIVVTPFERLKILLQTGQSVNNINKINLFQGLSATLTRETPGFAIYFATYNYLKGVHNNYLSKCHIDKTNIPTISPLVSFSFGALAGASAWVFIYPQDRIKTHMQAARDSKIGFIEAFKHIRKTEGITSFYRGFHLALCRAIPLHATAFTTVELCKKYFDD
jgi:solute carrier family 25 carnitine/acylcarnitine transporter 20/29